MSVRIRNKVLGSLSLIPCLMLIFASRIVAQGLDANRATIHFETDEEQIVLGRTKQASIRASVLSEHKKLLSAEDFRFHVNVGRFSEVEMHDDGTASVEYFVPDSYHPQWAIVIVTARTQTEIAVGILRIALHGVGEVTVTSRPRAKVYLTIGDTVFGPETTDKNGKATIPIVSPPGMKYGKAAGKKIDLELPPANRISIAAESELAIAGASEPIALWIYCTDAQGNPLENAALSIESDRGAVTDPVSVEAGVYRAEYTSPATLGLGRDSVSVSLSDDPTSKDRAEIRLIAGRVRRVAMELSTTEYRAGQTDDLLVRVSVMDKEGNPASAEVAIESDWGRIENFRHLRPGFFVGRLEVPNRIPKNRNAIRVRALATDKDDRFVDEKEIAISPGPPTTVHLPAPLPTYERSQETPTRIPIAVVDQFDNPVSDAAIQITTSHSDARIARTQKPGQYLIEFFPDSSTKKSDVVVDLETSEIRSTFRLRKKREKLIALGLRAGYLTNFSGLHLGCVEVDVTLDLPKPLRGGLVSIGSGYYFTTKQVGQKLYKDQEIGYDSKVHMFPLMGALGYRHSFSTLASLFLTGGVGAHFLIHRMTQTDAPNDLTRTAAFRAHGFAGTEFKVGPGAIEILAGYIYTGRSGDETIDGRTGGFQLLIGYKYFVLR